MSRVIGATAKDAPSRSPLRGGLDGSCFVEMTAFLTMTVFCKTANCRYAPRPTLHRSGAQSPAAMNRSPRRTPAADSPLHHDLSGSSACLPAQTVSWFCSVRIDSAEYLQNLVISFKRRGSEANTHPGIARTGRPTLTLALRSGMYQVRFRCQTMLSAGSGGGHGMRERSSRSCVSVFRKVAARAAAIRGWRYLRRNCRFRPSRAS